MARSYAGNAIVMILVQDFCCRGSSTTSLTSADSGAGHRRPASLIPSNQNVTDHVVIALACIAASLLSIVVPVVTALRFF